MRSCFLNALCFSLYFVLFCLTAHVVHAADCAVDHSCSGIVLYSRVMIDGVDVRGDAGYSSSDIIRLFDIPVGREIDLDEATNLIAGMRNKLAATGQFEEPSAHLTKSLSYPHYMIVLELKKRRASYLGGNVSLAQKSDQRNGGRGSGLFHAQNAESHAFWGTREFEKSGLALDVEVMGQYRGMRGDIERSSETVRTQLDDRALGFNATILDSTLAGGDGYWGMFLYANKSQSKGYTEYNELRNPERSEVDFLYGSLLFGRRWGRIKTMGALSRYFSHYSSKGYATIRYNNKLTVQSEEYSFRDTSFGTDLQLAAGYTEKSGLLLVEPGSQIYLNCYRDFVDSSTVLSRAHWQVTGEYTLMGLGALAVTPVVAADWQDQSEEFEGALADNNGPLQRQLELGARLEWLLGSNGVLYAEMTRHGGRAKDLEYSSPPDSSDRAWSLINHFEVGTKYASPDLMLRLSFIYGAERLVSDRTGNVTSHETGLDRLTGGK